MNFEKEFPAKFDIRPKSFSLNYKTSSIQYYFLILRNLFN